MEKKIFTFGLCLVLLLSFIIPAANANIFLSSDNNIINPLTGSYNTSIDTGNQQFFSNVLAGGSNVGISTNNFPGSLQTVNDDLADFYSNTGANVSIIEGPLTSLIGLDLLIIPLPNDSYEPGEISVMNSFLGLGGTLFFLGENNAYSTENSYINNALSALGSSMSIVDDIFDPGFNTATGSQIANDFYTNGVLTFTYAAPAQIILGDGIPLFFGTQDQPFLAYEGAAPVPEPSTFLLLGGGLAGLAFYVRRRKKE